MVFPMVQPGATASLDQFFGTAWASAERGVFDEALGGALSGSASTDALAPLAASITSQPKQPASRTAEGKDQKKDRTDEKDEAQNVVTTVLVSTPLVPTPCVPLPVLVDSPPTFAAARPVADGPAQTPISNERKISPENAHAGGPASALSAKGVKSVSGVETRQSKVEEDTCRGDSAVRIPERDALIQYRTTQPPSADPSVEPEQSQPGIELNRLEAGVAVQPPAIDQSNDPGSALATKPPMTESSSSEAQLTGVPLSVNVSTFGPKISLIPDSRGPDIANAPRGSARGPLADTPQLTPVFTPRHQTVASLVSGGVRAVESERVPDMSEQATVASQFMDAPSPDRANSLHDLRANATSHTNSVVKNVNPPAPARDLHEVAAQPTRAEERTAGPASDQSKPNPPTSIPAPVIQSPALTSSNLSFSAVPSPALSTTASPAQPSPAHSQSAEVTANTPPHDLPQSTPAAPLPVQIQAARIVQNGGRAEMKLDMRTATFGAVEIRTTVAGKDVQLAVSAEHGDLRSFLAPEMPILQNSLQQHDLRLEHIRTLAHPSTQSEFSSGYGRQEQGFLRQHPRTDTLYEPGDAEKLDDEDSPRSVSIRI